MCIVAEEHQFVALYLKVETAIHTSVCLHSIFQFFGITTVELCHCHRCNTIIDIDGHRLSEFHILHILYWRYEVEGDATVGNTDIRGMEVATIPTVGISSHSRLQLVFHLQSLVNDESPTRLNQ